MTAPDPALPPEAQLGHRAALASAYAVLQRLLVRAIGLISTLILVRLLTPEDFGIVGLAAIVQTILEILTAAGFGLALIRLPQVEPRHYDTAFTLTLARGLLVGMILFATADLQAAFMTEPRVAPVMRLLAATALLQSLENIRLVDLQRALRFDVLLRYQVLNKGLSFCAVVPLALWLRSHWALVLAPLLARLVLTPVSYWLVPYRPRLSLAAWRELFHFSKWILANNLVFVADAQSFTLIVGRTSGVAAVGLYQVVHQLAALPISELAAPIRDPAYAAFARVQHDRRALSEYLLAGLALQWLLIMPLSAGIALTPREITLLALGGRWSAAIGLFPLVALFTLCDGLRDYLGTLFVARNRLRLIVGRFALVTAPKVLVVLWAAHHHGLEGAAWAALAAAAPTVLLWLAMVRHELGCGWGPIGAALWRPALAALAMAAAVLAVPDDVGVRLGLAQAPLTVALLVKAGLGAALYAAVVTVAWLAVGAPSRSAEGFTLRGVRAGIARVLGGRQ